MSARAHPVGRNTIIDSYVGGQLVWLLETRTPGTSHVGRLCLLRSVRRFFLKGYILLCLLVIVKSFSRFFKLLTNSLLALLLLEGPMKYD